MACRRNALRLAPVFAVCAAMLWAVDARSTELSARPLLAQLSQNDADDLAFWSRIRDSRDADDYRAYLRQFPKGNFAPLARSRETEFARAGGSAAMPGDAGSGFDGEWRGTILGCYSKQETRMFAVVRGGRFASTWYNVAQIKEDAEGNIDASGRLRATGLNGLTFAGQAEGDRLKGTYTANSLPLLGPCAASFTLSRVSTAAPPLEAAAQQAQRAAGLAEPAERTAAPASAAPSGSAGANTALERERAEIEKRRLELERQKLEIERQRQDMERQRLAAKPAEIESMDREMVAAANANVRERPDSTSPVLSRLKQGDRADVTGKLRDENWYRVQLAGGRIGYVYGELLRPPPAIPVAAAAASAVPPRPPAQGMAADSLQLALMRQEPRHALVVGNATYRDLGNLRNPINDARAVAAKLRALGFKVALREDATRDALIRAIDEFGQQLRLGGVGVFFFAGHGVQVRGNNYMMPIDAAPRTEVAVAGAAVAAAYVLDYFADAGNRFNLMILDACRNNPLQSNFRTAGRGLAPIGRAPGGTMIAYATAPDSVAADGDGQNGLFTGELLGHMETPGLKVEDLFKRVTSAVRQRSGGDQIPWVTGSLEGDFYFRLPEAN